MSETKMSKLVKTPVEPIYIWDNGEGYSDHSIYFLHPDGLTPVEMAKLLLAIQSQHDWFQIGIAKGGITWWNGGSISVFKAVKRGGTGDS